MREAIEIEGPSPVLLHLLLTLAASPLQPPGTQAGAQLHLLCLLHLLGLAGSTHSPHNTTYLLWARSCPWGPHEAGQEQRARMSWPGLCFRHSIDVLMGGGHILSGVKDRFQLVKFQRFVSLTQEFV